MTLIALTTAGRVESLIVVGVVIWLVLALMVAAYGGGFGYPFFPLFVSAVFLGFPLVLLAVTIAAARRPLIDEADSFAPGDGT